MAIYLDHVFVLTEPGAPIADELISKNFIEGSSNAHPGQGTANRRFFFHGFTLEFIFLTDEQESIEGPGKGLRFVDRWRDHDASPFGLVVRSDSAVSFPHWLYWPDYFKGEMSFAVGENSSKLQEPLCICMPLNLPKGQPPESTCNKDLTLTNVDVSVAVDAFSETAKYFDSMDEVSLISDDMHQLELTFNEGAAGQSLDLLTPAPVRLIW